MPRGLEHELTIRLVCRRLPGLRFDDPYDAVVREPVHLGIQRGRDVEAVIPANRTQATFAARFRVRRHVDGPPNFLGPFAHGPVRERFIYLSWGVVPRSGSFEMFRRAKVHLSHLRWGEVSRAARAGRPLTVRLTMTDPEGGPRCASLRPPDARWEILS